MQQTLGEIFSYLSSFIQRRRSTSSGTNSITTSATHPLLPLISKMGILYTLGMSWLVMTILVILLVVLPKPVPYRWSIKFVFLQGLTFTQWLQLLKERRFRIDPVYWHRALFITIMSCVQSWWSYQERKKYPDELIATLDISQQEPVFIVGHYRTGTTLMHELLGMDDQMRAPTTFHCFSPNSVLIKEDEINKKYAKLSIRRPMDRMRISLKSPNEDEFALTTLGRMSPYMLLIFPAQGNEFLKYLTMQKCTKDEIAKWKQIFIGFCKKVLWKAPTKRLLLKSPVHTARIKLLLEVFPKAKFIHLARNPYEVYSSTENLHQHLSTQWRLQRLGDEKWFKDKWIEHLQEMEGAYINDFKLIQPENVIEVKFEDFAASPADTIETIYKKLRLPGFDQLKPKLVEFEQEKHKNHKKNEFKPLSDTDRKIVNEHWKFYFERFGYQMDHH